MSKNIDRHSCYISWGCLTCRSQSWPVPTFCLAKLLALSCLNSQLMVFPHTQQKDALISEFLSMYYDFLPISKTEVPWLLPILSFPVSCMPSSPSDSACSGHHSSLLYYQCLPLWEVISTRFAGLMHVWYDLSKIWDLFWPHISLKQSLRF